MLHFSQNLLWGRLLSGNSTFKIYVNGHSLDANEGSVTSEVMHIKLESLNRLHRVATYSQRRVYPDIAF